MIDLDKLSKEEHYKIPEDYFEQLPSQVMNAIHKEQRKKRTLWMSGIAAVAALVICSTIVVKFMSDDEVKGSNIVIANQTTEQQLEDQMADYYSDELAQIDYYNY
ncbi:MAG: hypothetical protein MJZ57_03035 [Bacteroidales bacterium]|nr:hypothetical protein [Bacteroidales bacterium]